MNKSIYLAWQEPKTRQWHVIGRLLRTQDGYEFCYTQGVKNVSSFPPLLNMPSHQEVYRSSELFSLFKNRLMPKSRPDYQKYMSWLSLDNKDNVSDDLEVLAISGGERETDFFRIIPVPEKNARGDFSLKFFAHGLSHLDHRAKERTLDLVKGERLYLMHDFQNESAPDALLLRTENPPCLVGYVPAFFTKIILQLKNEAEKSLDTKIRVEVLQVNKDAPVQMQLLCELSAPFLKRPWEEYEPEFKLLVS